MAAVARLIEADTPSTPHRIDAYAVLKAQHLDPISPISRREMVVREFGKSLSKDLSLPEGRVEKITTFESPEKWVIHHDDKSYASIKDMLVFMRPPIASVILRILLDALLYLLGHRPVEWTDKEKAEWKAKQKDGNSLRGKVVRNSEGKLLQEGFTTAEIRALFAATLRTELNDSAHTMRLPLAASILKHLDVTAVSKTAVEKAFKFVCGVGMDQVDPRSDLILTSTGIRSGHADQYMFEGEERWDEVGTWD